MGRGKAVLRALAALTTLALPFVLGVASCTSILGLDDDTDAAGELCQLLDRCYGHGGLDDCDAHVGKRLDAATAAAKKKWLQSFGDTRCLSSCKSARGCLDLSPVCKPASQDCEVSEECCGFTKGLASCDPNAKSCCHPRGVPCKKDEDCCADAGRCIEETGTCGGVVCIQAFEPCTAGAECCTKICLPDGTCSPDACFADGFGCGTDLDCCNGFCNPNTGLCGKTECAGLTAPCIQPTECCDGFCFFSPYSDQGACSIGDCQPDGLSCASGEPCCSGFCDPNFLTCVSSCQELGAGCAGDAECCSGYCPMGACDCIPDFGGCFGDGQCCSGLCLGGVCQTAGCGEPGSFCSTAGECCSDNCNSSTCTWSCGGPTNIICHDPCKLVGGVLDPSCSDIDTGCITAICQADLFCCCTEWDQLCKDELGSICNQVCPG